MFQINRIMVKEKSEKIEKPTWLKMKEDELKKIIAELAKKYQPAQVGLILRDQYGIPTTRLYGKKLSHYLKEAGLETNADLTNAEKKFEKIKEHLTKNRGDKKAKHKLQKAQSRVNILRRYFKRKIKK